jgi:uncharacterized membrane protein
MLDSSDFRRIAREALNGRWALAIGTGFVAALFGVNFSSGNRVEIRNNYTDLFNPGPSIYMLPFVISIVSVVSILVIVAFLFGGVIEIGYSRFNKNLIQNTNPQFKDLFSRFDIFWKAFGLSLLIKIFVFLWTLLLIIPGIIASISYTMAPYIMEENPSMGIMEAIQQSKDLMYGNKWRYFCLSLSFIGWIFLSALSCGIGFLWLNPYVNAAKAAFYYDIKKNENYESQI